MQGTIEIWEDIKGYKGYYQVSNKGRIKSLERIVKSKNNSFKTQSGKLLKLATDSQGYSIVNLSKKNKQMTRTVHRLVAETFIPNPYNKNQVNHIDENKKNNNIKNLEWCSAQYNTQYSLGKKVRQISNCGKYIKTWASAAEVERQLGINNTSISACCNNIRKTAGGYKWEFTNVGG